MSNYLQQRRAFIEAGRPLPEKKKHTIAKVSEKRKKKLAEMAMKGDDALDKWFEDRRREMTGKCVLCGGKTEKHNDDTYRNSIHHILEKRPTMFPSVALHEDNWLEVCFYGNSCHTNIHNSTITWELLHDSKEWEIIATKFQKIYPFIAENEKKNIPELLLKTIES